MNLDVDKIQSLLQTNGHERVLAILENNKHSIIDELEAHLDTYQAKRKIPQDLYIEHLKLSDNDVIIMINIMRKRLIVARFSKLILLIFACIAILISFKGLILLFTGDETGAAYLCTLPGGMFLLYLLFLKTY